MDASDYDMGELGDFIAYLDSQQKQRRSKPKIQHHVDSTNKRYGSWVDDDDAFLNVNKGADQYFTSQPFLADLRSRLSPQFLIHPSQLSEFEDPFAKFPHIQPAYLGRKRVMIKRPCRAETKYSAQFTSSCGIDHDEVAVLGQEIDLLSRLRHPNVIKFIGMSTDFGESKRNSWMVMEAGTRDMAEFFQHVEASEGADEWQDSITEQLPIAFHIALGMAHVHSHGIVHSDLKPKNIICVEIGHERVWKVCDFGGAFCPSYCGPRCNGTPCYQAPELWNPDTKRWNGTYAQAASDVFSYSMILYTVSQYLISPWDNPKFTKKQYERERMKIPDLLLQGERPFIYDEDSFFVDLLHRCWARRPGKRPTFNQIAEHLEPAMKMYCNRYRR